MVKQRLIWIKDLIASVLGAYEIPFGIVDQTKITHRSQGSLKNDPRTIENFQSEAYWASPDQKFVPKKRSDN